MKNSILPISAQKSIMLVAAVTTVATSLAVRPSYAAPSQTGSTDQTRLFHRHQRATPPDSFLIYKVYSVDQLIDQVRSNPRVQNYYARHFHVPQSRVVEYMQANLVESYIPETKVYTCYCVRSNGLIYPVKQKFEQGTKVFALRNGEPVLKWVCGNPLSRFLPAVEKHTVTRFVPVIKVAPETDIVSPTDDVQVVVPTETATTASSSDLDTLVPQSIVGAATPQASSFVLVPTAAGAGLSAWTLAAIPAAFGIIHFSHSSSSGSTPNSKPAPVPEASTFTTSAVVLAGGFLLFGLRRRSSREA